MSTIQGTGWQRGMHAVSDTDSTRMTAQEIKETVVALVDVVLA